jgi:hypothetical protein
MERIIVIGDLHGDIAILCSCLYMTKIINTDMEWIADPPNTIVVQIGDQLDSASRDITDSWEKLDDLQLLRFTDKLDQMAQEKGGRFISLVGNHEMMNIIGDFSYVSEYSLEKAGGRQGRIAKLKPGGEYAEILSKRVPVLKIGKLLFCHAGLLPIHINLVNGDIDKINSLYKDVILGKHLTPDQHRLFQILFVDQQSILWNRQYVTHYNQESFNMLQYVLEKTNCIAMLIGHNTMEHITNIYNNRLWITDVGLSRSFSNRNLEVLEIINGKEFNIIHAKRNSAEFKK